MIIVSHPQHQADIEERRIDSVIRFARRYAALIPPVFAVLRRLFVFFARLCRAEFAHARTPRFYFFNALVEMNGNVIVYVFHAFGNLLAERRSFFCAQKFFRYFAF